jgi:putative membrane protein
VAVPWLDAGARAALGQAIAAIESGSAVEVVIAVRRASAAYRHANALIGGAVAFAGLAAMLFSDHVFALSSILFDPFAVGGAAGALVELLPDVKRLLAPTAMREREVRRAARASFVERGVHHTRDRSGVLIYVSWLERRVAVIADDALERALPGDARDRAERALSHALPRGGAALADELARLAPVFAAAMPRRADDVNELPDAIDSDLERVRRPRS